MLRSFQNCERSAWTLARSSSNTLMGRPPGLACVLSMSGGMAPIDGLGHALGAVTANIAGDFAAPGGVAAMDTVLQVKLLDEFPEIVGISVHVIAVPGLTRPAMAAAIMDDAAIAVRSQ